MATSAAAEPSSATREAAEVDKLFAAYDRPGSPGCAVGVIRDGVFVHKRGYGLANVEHNIPFDGQSRVYLASVSKQFTAAAVILAAERGALSLDDDIRKFLPAMPDYGAPITVGHLLHQSSGLRDFLTMILLSGERMEDVHEMPEILALIARQKALNFVPGTRYEYSNSNYLLLGEVLRAATGQSLREFARVNIFEPLGMTHTFYADDIHEVIADRAASYSLNNGKVRLNWSINFTGGGAGDVVSTVDDLLAWDQNFYADRLGRAVVATMRKTGVLNDGAKNGYAGGLMMTTYRGLPVERHSGSMLGFSTMIGRFPTRHFSAIALCNIGGIEAWQFAERIADIYLEKSMPSKGVLEMPFTEAQLKAHDLEDLTGLYRNRQTGLTRSFSIAQGRLLLNGSTVLYAGDAKHFRNASGGRYFDFSRKDKAVETDPYAEDFERVVPTAQSDLEAFAGDYFSTDLGVVYHLKVEGNGLSLSGPKTLAAGGDRFPGFLTPEGHDDFYNSRFALHFSRNAAGQVTGFTSNAGRVQNVAFERKAGGRS